MGSIIGILTDFGIADAYIASMKGIILEMNPSAIIVDVAHSLPKFNIRYAAFILASAYKFFPKGTIFVGVVDPGVGSAREPIVLKTKNYYFVGPNNGLFTIVADRDGIETIRVITNKAFMREKISPTFHGRDIFAPTAAMLSLGAKVEDAGPELPLERFVRLDIGRPIIEENRIIGEVLVVDSFGNIITNIMGSEFPFKLGDEVVVKIGEKKIKTKFLRTYHDADLGDYLVLIGSHEFVEIAQCEGCAACNLKVKEGVKVIIEKA